MKKHKFRLNSLIVLILSIFLLWYVLKDNFNESLDILLSAKVLWIVLAFVVFFIYFLLETIVIKKLVNVHKKDYSLKSSLKLHMMTRFFNGVTPFSTGGQPLQVYELKKEGVRITDGTTVIIKHFIIYQSSIVFLALIALIFNSIFNVLHFEGLLKSLLILGYIINIGLLVLVYSISISKKFTQKVVVFVINILAKLKIVKNKEQQIEKWRQACLDYYDSFRSLVKNKKLFFSVLAIEILAIVAVFTLPIFIFEAIGYTYNINIFICILTSIHVNLVGSYVPIPGGTGGMEYAFIGFFSQYIPGAYISPAVILWRVVDYYIPVVIGGIVFNYEKAKRDRIKEK